MAVVVAITQITTDLVEEEDGEARAVVVKEEGEDTEVEEEAQAEAAEGLREA